MFLWLHSIEQGLKDSMGVKTSLPWKVHISLSTQTLHTMWEAILCVCNPRISAPTPHAYCQIVAHSPNLTQGGLRIQRLSESSKILVKMLISFPRARLQRLWFNSSGIGGRDAHFQAPQVILTQVVSLNTPEKHKYKHLGSLFVYWNLKNRRTWSNRAVVEEG